MTRNNVAKIIFAAFGGVLIFFTFQRQPSSQSPDPHSQMIQEHLIHRGISDSAVLQAMRDVKRELFVLPEFRSQAYMDGPLPIGHEQTISQPYIVALMTQAAQLKPSDRVLEVGTGSGYQAAVLAEIVDQVYTIEIIEPLANESRERLKKLGYDNVEVRYGNGYEGWIQHAPFNAIIVTAAPPEIPKALIEQLAEGGRLVVPVGTYYQELVVITKTPQGFIEEKLTPVRFVPMVQVDRTKK